MTDKKVYETVGYVSSLKICSDALGELEVGFVPTDSYSLEVETYASCLLVDMQDSKTDVNKLDKNVVFDSKLLRFTKGESIKMKVEKRLLLAHLLLTAKVNHTKVRMHVVIPDGWNNKDKEKFPIVTAVEFI